MSMREQGKAVQMNAHAERSFGLDLLRVISMLMIVVLHSSSHGGMASVPPEGVDALNYIFWTAQAMSIVSVNVFVLISAWFLCEQPFRLSRVVRVALPVLFYSWLMTAGFWLVGRHGGFSDLLSGVLPISFRRYWFITAYLGMYLLTPVLNQVISALDRRQHLAAVLVCLMLGVVWSDLIPMSDPFAFSGGYGLAWFVVLYLIAAYLRRHVDRTRIRHTWGIYFLCVALLMLSLVVLRFLAGEIAVLAEYGVQQYYFRYNSSIVLVASVALLLAFEKMPIRSAWLRQLIGRIAPLTMGVYLIHDNPGIREILWREWLPLYRWERNWLLPAKVMGAVLLIFCVCLLLEAVRQWLFRMMEKGRWYQKAMREIDRLPNMLYNKLIKN